ncbi:hypothetical protein GCM10009789_04440 [Kribbella sancticallisti]|uniref:Uncharacterized protein n=1 Tax=Kribbella sancticallisti TaxID=460087 RepID=A0ABN2CA72_9ACTN
MDYICYISRSKVDSLHAQLQPEQYSDITEQLTNEVSKSGELQAGVPLGPLANLFKGGASYGRRNVIQVERKVKTAYVEKLRDVLLAIATDHGDIPDLRDADLSEQPLRSVYYFYEGAFRVVGAVTETAMPEVVTLRSSLGRRKLLVDCSLRYFSENPDPTGPIRLHSGNYAFFTRGLKVRMSGVLVVSGVQGREVSGSPLYLQLSSAGDVVL